MISLTQSQGISMRLRRMHAHAHKCHCAIALSDHVYKRGYMGWAKPNGPLSGGLHLELWFLEIRITHSKRSFTTGIAPGSDA